MSQKRNYPHLITTGLFSAMMLMSATMYFAKNDMVSEMFTKLGFPTYIIYPLAIAKILGVVALWQKKSRTITEWAYAGFFFDFLLAGSAHIVVQDGEFFGAVIAMALLMGSYFTGKRA